MTTVKLILALALAAPIGTPAIAASKYPIAITSFETVARLSPSDGGAQIELAGAYARAGRVAEAKNALRRALTLDNMMLETSSGDAIWSHEVARRALSRDVVSSAR